MNKRLEWPQVTLPTAKSAVSADLRASANKCQAFALPNEDWTVPGKQNRGKLPPTAASRRRRELRAVKTKSQKSNNSAHWKNIPGCGHDGPNDPRDNFAAPGNTDISDALNQAATTLS